MSKFVPTPVISLLGLPDDMINYIKRFYPDRRLLWRHIDIDIFNKFTLKELVQMTFNIPELENVADNEPELAGVLRLTWTAEDPILLFAALLEEVACEKKPYKVLFRPLILYLFRTFHAFDDKTREMYKNYFSLSVEDRLFNACIKKFHYDLLFDLFDAEALYKKFFSIKMEVFANFQYRELFIEILLANPAYASKYLNLLFIDKIKLGRHNERQVSFWISNCIVYDLPQSYYTVLFENDPVVLEYMINHLLNSTDIPESENERIYNQVSDHLTTYSCGLENTPKLKYLRMINDIRFGSFDLDEFRATQYILFDKNTFIKLGKAALLANKRNLFSFIYENSVSLCRQKVMDEIVEFDHLDVTVAQAKNFRMIFELIHADSDIFQNEMHLIYFVKKFYAFNRITRDCDQLTFSFTVSENLLDYGFPPAIILKMRNVFVCENILSAEVADESTIIPLIHYLVAYNKNFPISISLGIIAHKTSFKVLEVISKLPELLEFMIENRVKLYFKWTPGIEEEYFNLENFDLINRLMHKEFMAIRCEFTDLKNQSHIAKLEIITGSSVADIFFKWENSNGTQRKIAQGHAKILYFKWRSVFAYWIKGPQRARISQIQTPKFKELLKLDFPNETADLF